MKVAPRDASPRCVYCHQGLGGEAVTCPGCATLVHEDCQLDRCPTLGCDSLEPWQWVDLGWVVPESKAGPGRRSFAAAGIVLAAAVVPVLWVGQAPRLEAPALRTGSTPSLPVTRPHRPESAWYGLGRGSVLATRTETTLVRRGIACGPGTCQAVWSLCADTPVERHYRLLYFLDGFARVEVKLLREDRRRLWKRLREGRRRLLPMVELLRFDRWPEAPASAELIEERKAEVVTVPAGTFICTYRKEEGPPKHGRPTVVETWTDGVLPLPVLRVVTWHEPRAPDDLLNTERTFLLSLALRPTDPPSPR